jgi:hypothetical protein
MSPCGPDTAADELNSDGGNKRQYPTPSQPAECDCSKAWVPIVSLCVVHASPAGRGSHQPPPARRTITTAPP